jgi:disulfide oxidoreductase YuzD
MVQEMCANSIEHANETNMNWLFAVYYENEKVIFTMTDIGNGILKTLKRKAMQIISDKIGKDDIEILDRAYDKKYMSITSDQNRNKGLPKIKRISTENYIDNLIVITNNVILHLNDESESRIMRKKFHGTFYYWELTKTCIEKWKNREL